MTKRLFASLLSICLALFVAAACGGEGSDPYPEPSDPGSSWGSGSGSSWGSGSGSSGSSYGSGSSSDSDYTPPSKPTTPKVCVYKWRSYTSYAGQSWSKEAWRCSASYTTLSACRAAYKTSRSSGYGVSGRTSYSQHQILDGPCSEALARVRSGGTSGTGTGSGSGSGSTSSTTAFGRYCSTTSACPSGYTCLTSSGSTRGFCSKTCSEAGGLCSGAPSGTLAACVLKTTSGKLYCGFICKVSSKSYSCPGSMRCSSVDNPVGSAQRSCEP